MKRKIILLIALFCISTGTLKSIQEEDSLKSIPDTIETGSPYLGDNLTKFPPLAELGPYVQQPQKKTQTGVYLIVSLIVLVTGAALYFFRNKLKKKDQ